MSEINENEIKKAVAGAIGNQEYTGGKGTEEMPEPRVADYRAFYKVNTIFLNDLKICFAECEYVTVKNLLQPLEENNYILPLAMLQEYINKLQYFPWIHVNPLLCAIHDKTKFDKYFTRIKE